MERRLQRAAQVRADGVADAVVDADGRRAVEFGLESASDLDVVQQSP